MAIYEISADQFRKISETSFSSAGLRERQDLQRLLRHQIEVISPDTLVVSEEFSHWEDSNRRIDLLGIDKDANLVVVELKRSEDGGHMELQAVRYAAMVSTMTFDDVVQVYSRYLDRLSSDQDARESILEFLGWEQADDDEFAQDVRIVLASAEFSKELTTAVMWLNERQLDIRCIRLKPYQDAGRTFVDVQQIVPLPEAAEYQVRIKQKQGRERASRDSKRSRATYDVTCGGETYESLPKRRAIYVVASYLCSLGHTPEDIADIVHWRRTTMFRSAEGHLNREQFVERMRQEKAAGGRAFDEQRFFCDRDELIVSNGKTYAFSNQWRARTLEAIDLLAEAFPEAEISYQEWG